MDLQRLIERVESAAREDDVQQILLRSPFKPQLPASTKICSVLAKNGQPGKALKVYESLGALGLVPDKIVTNAAIAAAAKGGWWQTALALFNGMEEQGLERDTITYTSTIGAMKKGKQWELAIKVFQHMLESGLEADMVTCCSLLEALKSGHQWELAEDLFMLMCKTGQGSKAIDSKLAWELLRNATQAIRQEQPQAALQCKVGEKFSPPKVATLQRGSNSLFAFHSQNSLPNTVSTLGTSVPLQATHFPTHGSHVDGLYMPYPPTPTLPQHSPASYLNSRETFGAQNLNLDLGRNRLTSQLANAQISAPYGDAWTGKGGKLQSRNLWGNGWSDSTTQRGAAFVGRAGEEQGRVGMGLQSDHIWDKCGQAGRDAGVYRAAVDGIGGMCVGGSTSLLPFPLSLRMDRLDFLSNSDQANLSAPLSGFHQTSINIVDDPFISPRRSPTAHSCTPSFPLAQLSAPPVPRTPPARTCSGHLHTRTPPDGFLGGFGTSVRVAPTPSAQYMRGLASDLGLNGSARYSLNPNQEGWAPCGNASMNDCNIWRSVGDGLFGMGKLSWNEGDPSSTCSSVGGQQNNDVVGLNGEDAGNGNRLGYGGNVNVGILRGVEVSPPVWVPPSCIKVADPDRAAEEAPSGVGVAQHHGVMADTSGRATFSSPTKGHSTEGLGNVITLTAKGNGITGLEVDDEVCYSNKGKIGCKGGGKKLTGGPSRKRFMQDLPVDGSNETNGTDLPKSRVPAHVGSCNALLCAYTEASPPQWEKALALLDVMCSGGPGQSSNASSFNYAIEACSGAGQLGRAIEVYHEMLEHGCRPNLHTFRVLLGAAQAVKDFNAMREIKQWMHSHGQQVA